VEAVEETPATAATTEDGDASAGADDAVAEASAAEPAGDARPPATAETVDDSVAAEVDEDDAAGAEADETEADASAEETSADAASDDTPDDDAPDDDEPRSIEEHVQEVLDAESERARLLGDDRGVLAEVAAAEAFDAVEAAETAPHTVVVDGRIGQKLLDVAAQRGVSELLGRDVGQFVKRPVGPRVLTIEDLRAGS